MSTPFTLCGLKTQASINKLSILMRPKSIVILADLQKWPLLILYSDDQNEPPEVNCFLMVTMGILSSPFLHNTEIKHHLRQFVENSEDQNEVEAA